METSQGQIKYFEAFTKVYIVISMYHVCSLKGISKWDLSTALAEVDGKHPHAWMPLYHASNQWCFFSIFLIVFQEA